MTSKSINLAEYLFSRLHQLGCKSLHGLPGDFNLLALDYVEPSGLRWVGNCNELNAGYAADAYARVRGLGAIMTTFGVGELSAVNAVAGAFAERSPVVHIVGTPPRAAQEGHAFLHHTLGNGDYHVFSRIHKEITIAQADLIDLKTAPAEIDRVLRACYIECRPIYIQLPTDMVTKPVEATLLDEPIDISPMVSEPDEENDALQQMLSRLYSAERPAILVDALVARYRLIPEADALIRKLNIPTFTTPMGKSAVDESLPCYISTYVGSVSDPDVKAAMEQSDLILTLGEARSDLNTGGFSYGFSQKDVVAIAYDHCTVGHGRYDNVYAKPFIPKLTDAIEKTKMHTGTSKFSATRDSKLSTGDEDHDSDVITHKWLWTRIGQWLEEGDLIVTDTGTSYVGYWSTALPQHSCIINQILWSSIGYGVGAAQGAGLAAKDNGKGQRTICFEGDGSFQLTAQELSTIIRHDLNVTMFLIENEGYTIERFVHGLEASYNDIAQWNYSELPAVFTPKTLSIERSPKIWNISSREELESLLQDEKFASGKGLQFVEIHIPKLDAPQALKDFGKNASERAS